MRNWLKEIRTNFKYMDKLLFILILLFAAFGLVVVFSSSNIPAVLHYHYKSTYFFVRQLIVTIVGIVVMFAIALKPRSKAPRFWVLLGTIGVFISMVWMFSRMTRINGSSSWLNISSFSLQPSEFFKSFIIIALAVVYGTVKQFKDIWHLLIPIGGVIIIALFVAFEPDLGTAAIIGIITTLIFFSLPINDSKIRITKYVLFLIAIVGVVAIYLLQPKFIQQETTSRQMGRLAFTNPCSRPLVKTGYQVCNAYIAINNGGLLGRGIGNSTQKFLYLPEAFTDFVFPIVIEEIGVLGAAGVILCYILLLLRLLIIARNAKNLQDSIIAFGTFTYILSHVLVNLLGVLALIPLTGVPLPFLSYGGSFLINLFILLGFTLNVSAHNNAAKKGV